MIKAVLFDFFDVLVSDGERLFFEKYVPEGSSVERQADQVVDSFMKGDITYATYRKQLAEITGLALEEVARWLDDNRPNQDLLNFIRSELKDHYKLGIISNSGDDWIEDMLGKENAALFDEITLSFRIGHMKPEPEIYTITAEKLGVLPEDCFYTDDKERYCEAARNVGMKAILFKDTAQFIADFQDTAHV